MNLTPEQISRAAEAMFGVLNKSGKWTDSLFIKEQYRKCAQVVAPLLQAPIAEPTEEEIAQIRCSMPAASTIAGVVQYALSEFVKLRNSPKPLTDREKVMEILRSAFPSSDYYESATTEILRTLNKVSALAKGEK